MTVHSLPTHPFLLHSPVHLQRKLGPKWGLKAWLSQRTGSEIEYTKDHLGKKDSISFMTHNFILFQSVLVSLGLLSFHMSSKSVHCYL